MDIAAAVEPPIKPPEETSVLLIDTSAADSNAAQLRQPSIEVDSSTSAPTTHR